MPLPEDLLAPIEGEKPAGQDLYYDNLFVLIKEARREDENDLPEGDWGRSKKKKADHRAAIKLAGEALAKRTKDLRLAGWLIESQIRVDGFQSLAPGIELLRSLQERFWPDIYPLIEEENDLEMRIRSVEAAGKLIAEAARKVPLTRSGLSFDDYQESRLVGYEKDASTVEKLESRKEAIDLGKVCAEEFDKDFAGSPKSFYVNAEAALAESIQAAERLVEYQKQAYGSDCPNLSKLLDGLEEIHRVVESLLNERRKIEPDPVAATVDVHGRQDTEPGSAEENAGAVAHQVPRSSVLRKSQKAVQLSQPDDAYALIVESAEFLSARDPKSPVPYLVCSGLRLGETRMQGSTPSPGFAVGPAPEVRQALRILAAKGEWRQLMGATLPILASECARAWLDLHRYIWRAGKEIGAEEISEAVVGTMKSLLNARPELRHWTLEDDTGAANPETQQWLDGTVLQ